MTSNKIFKYISFPVVATQHGVKRSLQKDTNYDVSSSKSANLIRQVSHKTEFTSHICCSFTEVIRAIRFYAGLSRNICLLNTDFHCKAPGNTKYMTNAVTQLSYELIFTELSEYASLYSAIVSVDPKKHQQNSLTDLRQRFQLRSWYTRRLSLVKQWMVGEAWHSQ